MLKTLLFFFCLTSAAVGIACPISAELKSLIEENFTNKLDNNLVQNGDIVSWWVHRRSTWLPEGKTQDVFLHGFEANPEIPTSNKLQINSSFNRTGVMRAHTALYLDFKIFVERYNEHFANPIKPTASFLPHEIRLHKLINVRAREIIDRFQDINQEWTTVVSEYNFNNEPEIADYFNAPQNRKRVNETEAAYIQRLDENFPLQKSNNQKLFIFLTHVKQTPANTVFRFIETINAELSSATSFQNLYWDGGDLVFTTVPIV